MNQFITLIKREFWEHKTSAFYAPLIISFGLGMFVIFANIRSLSGKEAFQGLSLGVSFGSMPSILLFIIPLIIISYAMNSLYEERKNKSLLFWRSMPVSDTKTVLSKVCFGVLVIPLLFIITWVVIATVSIVINSLIAGKMPPISFIFGLIVSVSIGFLTLSIMMLPYYTYLTFVSSISSRAPILIAILPFIIMAFVNMLIPESVVVYEYLFMPFELAVRFTLDVTRQIAEWTGVVDYLSLKEGFSLSKYYDFINHDYSKVEKTFQNGVTIKRSIEVDAIAMQWTMREWLTLLASIVSSVGFIVLSIFIRKRIQAV